MMTTVDQIMSLHPCEKYSRTRIEALWAGRPALGVSEIAALPIPVEDRVWALTRLVPHRAAIAWVCDCAERVLPAWEATHQGDDRPRRAIRVTRAWLRGEATIGEVRDAAYATAFHAAYAAAGATAGAAFATVYYAYYAAAGATAAAATAAYYAAAGATAAAAYYAPPERAAAYYAAPPERADVAFYAAYDAAHAAATAVGYTAYHAAPPECADAAYAASRDKERAWQLARLVELVEDEEDSWKSPSSAPSAGRA